MGLGEGRGVKQILGTPCCCGARKILGTPCSGHLVTSLDCFHFFRDDNTNFRLSPSCKFTFSQSVITNKTLAVSSEIENLLSLLETMRHVENMPEVKFTSPFIMK